MRKKAAVSILAGVMAMSLLAGCGSTTSESAATDDQTSAAGDLSAEAASADTDTAEAESGETVNITVQSWQYALGNYKGFSGDTELTNAIGEEFDATHSGIHADVSIMRQEDHYSSIRVDLASGEGPTVIGIAPGADLDQYKSRFEPLAPYAEEEWGTDWQDMFTEAAFSTIRLSGDEIYAFPSAMSASGLIWTNSQLLQEAGVQSDPTTWDELEAAAKACRDAGEIPLMYGGKDNWQNWDMFITIAGTINKDLTDQVFALEGDWTDSDMVKAFDYYQRLFTDGIVEDGALSTSIYNEGYSQWKDDDGNSTIPMIFNGSWDLGSVSKNNPSYDKFTTYGIHTITFPAIDGETGAILSTPDVAWAINKNATDEQKKAAWEFVKWLCYDMQQEVVDGMSFFSVLKDAPEPTVEMTDDYAAAQKVISDAMTSDKVLGFRSSFYGDLNTALFDQLQLLATGDTTPEKAAQAMADAASSISK